MDKAEFDLAIVGSGFAGSLLARIGRQLGLSVLLLEKQKHPRFAIGESSTPLANLLWEELCQRYDLADLAAFSKYGSWQKQFPSVGCGLKRGFSFYHHQTGKRFVPQNDHRNELLVAASPRDEIADTHWYRADFDHHLMESARKNGAEYFDGVNDLKVGFLSACPELEGTIAGKPRRWRAKFLIDATGPRGFLHHALSLPEKPWQHLPPTETLYAHFTGVKRWSDPPPSGCPFPPDDAAQHHVFEGGWIWILRFQNGVTSAGIAAHSTLAAELRLREGAPAWERVLKRFPSLAPLWEGATASTPFYYHPRLSFRSAQIRGEGWALLPSAAGFVDPLLSTGFPLTLLGVERLAELLEKDWKSPRFDSGLEKYAEAIHQELEATELLVAALYAHLGDFPSFASLTLLYFAAASFSETLRRLHRPRHGFLLHDHSQFGPAMASCCRLALDPATSSSRLIEEVARAIEPIDVAGLGKKERVSWFPVLASDLMEARDKLGASCPEIEQMLQRAGW